MRPEPASWRELAEPSERACARLARRAVLDTLFGGCRALNLADRCKHKQFPAFDIVSHVYSCSTGQHDFVWEAWSCPECGQVRLGQEAAYRCCNEESES